LAQSHVLKVTLEQVEPKVWRRIQVPVTATLDDLHLILQIAMGWQNEHLYDFSAGKRTFSPAEDPWDPLGLDTLEPEGEGEEDEEAMRGQVVEGLKQLMAILEHPEDQPEQVQALSTLIPGMGASGSPFDQMDEETSLTAVGEVLTRARSRMRYRYDFGDGWTHTIVVEKANVPTNAEQPAICLDGAGACPPEDCGGPWGYQRIVAAVQNPDDPEYADEREWMEDWIEDFDPNAFDRDAVNRSLGGLVWSLVLT
jgi:hypothetical protein